MSAPACAAKKPFPPLQGRDAGSSSWPHGDRRPLDGQTSSLDSAAGRSSAHSSPQLNGRP